MKCLNWPEFLILEIPRSAISKFAFILVDIRSVVLEFGSVQALSLIVRDVRLGLMSSRGLKQFWFRHVKLDTSLKFFFRLVSMLKFMPPCDGHSWEMSQNGWDSKGEIIGWDSKGEIHFFLKACAEAFWVIERWLARYNGKIGKNCWKQLHVMMIEYGGQIMNYRLSFDNISY